MARVSPSEYAEKWQRRLKAAVPDITKGIDRVQTAPGVAAARAADRMLAGVTQAVSDGTWAAQVAGVSLEDWKDAAKTKGSARIAQGVDAAAPGQTDMATRLLANVDAAVSKVNATPRGDLETNIQRSATFQREMAARKLRRPSGR